MYHQSAQATGELRRVIRAGIYGILLLVLAWVGWHCIGVAQFMFFGKSVEYEGAAAERQLDYWIFPGAAALVGDIRGNDFVLGQGRLVHYVFTCDSAAFQALCAGIAAQEKIARGDSGTLKITEHDGQHPVRYTFSDNGEFSGTLSSAANAPDWWFSAEDADGSLLMEFSYREEGWGELLYMPETSKAWLYLAF